MAESRYLAIPEGDGTYLLVPVDRAKDDRAEDDRAAALALQEEGRRHRLMRQPPSMPVTSGVEERYVRAPEQECCTDESKEPQPHKACELAKKAFCGWDYSCEAAKWIEGILKKLKRLFFVSHSGCCTSPGGARHVPRRIQPWSVGLDSSLKATQAYLLVRSLLRDIRRFRCLCCKSERPEECTCTTECRKGCTCGCSHCSTECRDDCTCGCSPCECGCVEECDTSCYPCLCGRPAKYCTCTTQQKCDLLACRIKKQLKALRRLVCSRKKWQYTTGWPFVYPFRQDADHVFVDLDLPDGLAGINIQITDKELVVTGDLTVWLPAGQSFTNQERQEDRIRRSLPLPKLGAEVDPGQLQIEFKCMDEVVTVTLSKKAPPPSEAQVYQSTKESIRDEIAAARTLATQLAEKPPEQRSYAAPLRQGLLSIGRSLGAYAGQTVRIPDEKVQEYIQSIQRLEQTLPESPPDEDKESVTGVRNHLLAARGLLPKLLPST